MQVFIALFALLCAASAALMYLLCAFSGHTDKEVRNNHRKPRDHF